MVQFFIKIDNHSVICTKTNVSEVFSFTAKLVRGDYFLELENKPLSQPNFSKIIPNSTIYLKRSLKGGKGGFGATLKRQPTVKKRTDNYDSCRDLSGTRIRYVRQEQMLKEWVENQREEERVKQTYNDAREDIDKVIKANTVGKDLDKANKQYFVHDLLVERAIENSMKQAAKPAAKKKLVEEQADDNLLEFEL